MSASAAAAAGASAEVGLGARAEVGLSARARCRDYDGVPTPKNNREHPPSGYIACSGFTIDMDWALRGGGGGVIGAYNDKPECVVEGCNNPIWHRDVVCYRGTCPPMKQSSKVYCKGCHVRAKPSAFDPKNRRWSCACCGWYCD